MNTTEILRLIASAKSLDFGAIFSESIELFKKTWVPGLVTLLLTMVLAIPIVMIVYIPMIIMGISNMSSYDPSNPYNQPELSPTTMVVMFLLYIVMIIAMSVISTALKAGFYRICKLKDHDEMGIEDYFYFFKKPYLGQTVKVALTIMSISLLGVIVYVVLFFTFLFSSGPENILSNIPLLFLSILPMFYLIVPISYMVIVYAFNPDKSITEIIKLSFSLGNKKWLLTFGLLFVCGILASAVGMLMCFVGIYVTASFTYLQPYLIYKEVVGFEDESLQIGQEVIF